MDPAEAAFTGTVDYDVSWFAIVADLEETEACAFAATGDKMLNVAAAIKAAPHIRNLDVIRDTFRESESSREKITIPCVSKRGYNRQQGTDLTTGEAHVAIA